MLRPKQHRFLVRSFHFHALRFDIGIIFECVMDDAAIEGGERLKFDDVSPATDLFGGVLGFLDQSFAGLGAIAADVTITLGAF